jgi:hypothetical protein
MFVMEELYLLEQLVFVMKELYLLEQLNHQLFIPVRKLRHVNCTYMSPNSPNLVEA